MSSHSVTERPVVAAPQDGRGRSARWVLFSIFALSAILGVLAFWRYRQSEHHIRASIAAFERRGEHLDVEQCVDQVLAWNDRCAAMIGLCNASVSRMMNACLQAADRDPYCSRLTEAQTADTRFGKQACKRRGVNRRGNKACAAAYRMIAAHCAAAAASG